MPVKPEIKVYYNSACPVCKAGIERQMKKGSNCAIQWNDVHKNNGLVAEIDSGPDLEFVRERLHVVDENGNVWTGFDAFLVIWRNSPGEAWKSAVLGQPGIRHACRAVYNIFAAALYRWNRSENHW
ncbi:DUF393 domain-containing protein [Nitrosomonas sp. HPC101]|uniref:thiol-disulfide oxidoreductase DCC family protein n=1 Tax=Nitrosomonas sp. HPC101 TaxID=1658667 RepID=UPI001370B2F3|nr:DUF393 domain-containing protein [Nitrosomonas sp. HPC101]MXS85864.1 DUF393 domain-containing protein [Nitrosomonas sp. HPC101]